MSPEDAWKVTVVGGGIHALVPQATLEYLPILLTAGSPHMPLFPTLAKEIAGLVETASRIPTRRSGSTLRLSTPPGGFDFASDHSPNFSIRDKSDLEMIRMARLPAEPDAVGRRGAREVELQDT